MAGDPGAGQVGGCRCAVGRMAMRSASVCRAGGGAGQHTLGRGRGDGSVCAGDWGRPDRSALGVAPDRSGHFGVLISGDRRRSLGGFAVGGLVGMGAHPGPMAPGGRLLWVVEPPTAPARKGAVLTTPAPTRARRRVGPPRKTPGKAGRLFNPGARAPGHPMRDLLLLGGSRGAGSGGGGLVSLLFVLLGGGLGESARGEGDGDQSGQELVHLNGPFESWIHPPPTGRRRYNGAVLGSVDKPVA